MKGWFFVLSIFLHSTGWSQAGISRVWVADNGNGTYTNPVLHADYSDPDVIRVGNDYYMTASSFEDVPGLPLLHSRDLVNWTLIGHALPVLVPEAHFSVPRHGEGVWAPSLRYHKGEFYLYYPDPDFGIYLVKARHPAGPWSAPVLVCEGKGLIDPCPLWDDDGEAYLVHAFAGSRAGIKSILVVRKMNAEGTKTQDNGIVVYDGHELDPTIEGPKFYKRNGYYYIFAPAGGVASGWQTVLRSRSVYGPYERKVVMDQGATPVNGPHQGAWVTTQTGDDWFLHFQDKKAYGRVVHLQPLTWQKDWPVIGVDADGDGKGQPVLVHRKPHIGKTYPVQTPAESEEFNTVELGKQWQWMGNPKPGWVFPNPSKGSLRIFSDRLPQGAVNLWQAPNVLLQKFPAERFCVTTKMSFHPNEMIREEAAGLTVMGSSYASIFIKNTKSGKQIVYAMCKDASKANVQEETVLAPSADTPVYLRVVVDAGAKCRFSYSLDGKIFTEVRGSFEAQPGRWKGAKVGLFCIRNEQTNDSGFVDVDWFRVTAEVK